MLFGTGKWWRPCLLMAVGGQGGPAPWVKDVPPGNPRGAADSQPSSGILGELSNTLASARATLANVVDLISLEIARAGVAVVWMVALGVVAAFCLVMAWLGLTGALVMGVIALGLTPVAALIVVALINLVVAAILIKMSMTKSRDLLFSATRRQLAGKFSVPPLKP